MALVAYLLTLYFAATTGVAGLSKLRDRPTFAATLHQQQLLPAWGVVPVSWALPCFEVALAILLLTGWLSASVASGLVALFVVFLVVKIALFRAKSDAGCGCSGGATEQPVDAASITTSSILLILAALDLTLTVKFGTISWLWRVPAMIVALGFVAWVAIGTVRARMLAAPGGAIPLPPVRGLAVGTATPDFMGTDQFGRSQSLREYRGQRLVLAFVLPGCPGCAGTLQALKDRYPNEQLDSKQAALLLVGGAGAEENVAYATAQHLHMPMVTADGALAAFEVHSFPTLFMLNEQGVVEARGRVNGPEHLRALFREADSYRANVQESAALVQMSR